MVRLILLISLLLPALGIAQVSMGDANGDRIVNIADAVYVINYVFKGGDAPPLLYLPKIITADSAYLHGSGNWLTIAVNAPVSGMVVMEFCCHFEIGAHLFSFGLGSSPTSIEYYEAKISAESGAVGFRPVAFHCTIPVTEGESSFYLNVGSNAGSVNAYNGKLSAIFYPDPPGTGE